MALLQNQFSMSTVVGSKVSGQNVITAELYDASATTAFVPGEFVVLASTSNGSVPKVVKGTGLTELYFGVILTNPLKDSWVSGDKVEIGLATTIVYMTASAPFIAGSKLQYAYDTMKIATQTASNTVVGMAMDNAGADGALVRVYIQPNWLNNAGETNTLSSVGTAAAGSSLVMPKVVADLQIKRIKGATGITITEETNDIALSTLGEANTMSAAGTAGEGLSLVMAKAGVDLPVKRLLAGTGITLTATTNGIVVSLT